MKDSTDIGKLRKAYWSWRADPFGTRHLTRALRRDTTISKCFHTVRLGAVGKAHRGWCTVCARSTIFLIEDEWLRDNYRCVHCRSIPRFRHILHVLSVLFPDYRKLSIHESSASGPVYEKLRLECSGYVASQFWPDVRPGAIREGFRCENLESMSFPDQSFDIVVTQDVMEHVLNPDLAFREISRTLKPGGAHIFTVPWYPSRKTFVRASPSDSGCVYHAPKEFHGNPIDPEGSLVVTDWGRDLLDFIFQHGGLSTAVFLTKDRYLGLDGELLEVFVSHKPS